MDSMVTRKCIFIMGMHRSGTSAFSGVLKSLGIEVGDNLMVGNKHNEKGYFEDLDIVDLNDRILAHSGRDWDSLQANLISGNKFFDNEIKATYLQKFASFPLCALKDPRFSLTFPVWHAALQDLGIECYVVLAVRHPVDVYKSLLSRDKFSKIKSFLLWAQYSLNAELYSRKASERMIVVYDEFLEDPNRFIKELLQLASIDLGVKREKLTKVKGFLDPTLNHKQSSKEEIPANLQWVLDLYKIFTRERLDISYLDKAKVDLDNLLSDSYSTDITETLIRDHAQLISTLYIDEGDGYDETSKIEISFRPQRNKFVIQFDTLSPFERIRSIRWVPFVGGFFRLVVGAISVTTLDGRQRYLKRDILESNGKLRTDHSIEFQTSESWVEIQLRYPIQEITISGKIWVDDIQVTFKKIDFQMKKQANSLLEMREKNNRLGKEKAKWRAVVTNKESEINTLLKNKIDLLSQVTSQSNNISVLTKENTSFKLELKKLSNRTEELNFYKRLYYETPIAARHRWIKRFLFKFDRFVTAETFVPDSYLLNPLVFNLAYYRESNPQLEDRILRTSESLTDHWLRVGVYEGLVASESFDVRYYLEAYPDLKKFFKKNYRGAIQHWIDHGIKEKRRGIPKRGEKESPVEESVEQQANKVRTALEELLKKEDIRRPVLLYESHNLNLQGAPNSLYEIASGIKQLGNYHSVLMSGMQGPLSDQCSKQRLLCFSHGMSQSSFIKASDQEQFIRELGTLYQSAGAALVHVNTLQSFHCILAAHHAGIPTIWNIRESENPATYFNYLPAALREAAYSCFEKSKAIVFVAESTRAQWKSLLGEGVEHMVIPNGIDISRLRSLAYGTNRPTARISLGMGENDVLILNVGTVSARKGQQDLVDAIKLISAEHRQRLVLAIAGFNRSNYSDSISFQLQELEKQGLRIILLDETSSESERSRISELYLSADVFVLTSRLESYPRVILEAMEFGLPIISTPCFGVREQLIENQGALFYSEGDIRMLSEHIEFFLLNPEKRRDFGEAARKRLSSLNSYDEMLNAYEAIYKRLLQE